MGPEGNSKVQSRQAALPLASTTVVLPMALWGFLKEEEKVQAWFIN